MEASLPSHLQLEVVTPDRQVVRDAVGSVTLPGKGGYLGILPGHAPLLTELAHGELAFTQDTTARYLALSWGFAEILPDRVIVLAQTAERAEEIDVERATRARDRAQDLLRRFDDSNIDFERARAALARALARLQVAQRIRA